MKDLLIKKFENFLEPIKQKHNIGRINTFIFDDNNYQQDVEFILFQLELLKNREELIESSNLKKEYIMDELNPVIVNNVLKKEVFELLKKFYNKILKNNIFNFGDGDYGFKRNRYNSHNEIISRIIHFEMLELVEKITGKKLRPTYTYVSFYVKGAELKAHVDKAECEYTCSLIIDKPEGSNWNLYLHNKKTTIEEFNLNKNTLENPDKNECIGLDCDNNGFMILKGQNHLHFREILEYDYYNVLLLHYNVINNTCFSYAIN
tara:strand:- start:2847 stop:3632 length:786 start_codon:yes stop_codon:yes gene_type:complete